MMQVGERSGFERNVGIPVKVFTCILWHIVHACMFILLCMHLCIQALVNVPSLSERTLRRDIEKGNNFIGSEIQVRPVAQTHRVGRPHPSRIDPLIKIVVSEGEFLIMGGVYLVSQAIIIIIIMNFWCVWYRLL